MTTGLRTLILPGWKPVHVPLPTVCPPLIYREIEFLKKETAQRRVLEESELARKEEMDKLLDKVGPEVPRGQGRMKGAAGKPSSSTHSVDPGGREVESCCWLRAQSHIPTSGTEGAGPMPGTQA